MLGLRVALADGRIVDVGSRAIKNQTGYNLTQLVVGGRGALGVIVQATLRLWPRPSARRALLATYRFAPAATRLAAIAARLPLPPTAIEMLDATALEGASIAGTSVGPHGAALLVLVAGSDPSEVESRSGAVADCLAQTDGGGTVSRLDEPAAERAWAARRTVPSRLAAAWPDLFTVDVGVPIDRVESFVPQILGRMRARGVRVSLYGSVGLGAVSVAVLDAPPSTRMSVAGGLASHARAHGGQPLDIVGLGVEYETWLELILTVASDRVIPRAIAETHARLRGALDPRGTLRPART